MRTTRLKVSRFCSKWSFQGWIVQLFHPRKIVFLWCVWRQPSSGPGERWEAARAGVISVYETDLSARSGGSRRSKRSKRKEKGNVMCPFWVGWGALLSFLVSQINKTCTIQNIMGEQHMNPSRLNMGKLVSSKKNKKQSRCKHTTQGHHISENQMKRASC